MKFYANFHRRDNLGHLFYPHRSGTIADVFVFCCARLRSRRNRKPQVQLASGSASSMTPVMTS